MSLVKFVKGTEANITKLKSSSSVKEGALYVATDKGTMWLGTGTNSLLQIKDNINTTYSTGNTSVSGLTKLYGTTGSATDGTMTQSAITDAIKSATGEATLPNGFPEIKAYDYNVECSLVMSTLGSSAATSDAYYMSTLGSSATISPYAAQMRTLGASAPTYFPRTGDKSYFYLEKSTGTIYRWVPSGTSGSYIAYLDTLSLAGAESVAIGQYACDAYYGNKAYAHSQLTSGNPHKVTKSDVGLSNVENKSSEMIRREITKGDVVTALGYEPPEKDTDTHYASKNVVGSSTATSNTTTALTNGNVYLNSVENGAVTSTHKISGSGATTVTTDAKGNIVVSSTDTTYTALKNPNALTIKYTVGGTTAVAQHEVYYDGSDSETIEVWSASYAANTVADILNEVIKARKMHDL